MAGGFAHVKAGGIRQARPASFTPALFASRMIRRSVAPHRGGEIQLFLGKTLNVFFLRQPSSPRNRGGYFRLHPRLWK